MVSSPVNFSGLPLPVVESVWRIAGFVIRGVAVDFTGKGGDTGCGNLEEGCCELSVTGGIDENVTLVWAFISGDAVVTTFPRFGTASAEELLSITVLNCDCRYSCILP